MIDPELADSVRRYVAANPAVRECTSQEANELVARLAQRYDRSLERVWWWQDLHQPCERVSYGDADVMPIISARLGGLTRARLVITDDEPQPWLVLTGTVVDLLALVAEQRFFEYMLAADDASWMVFDTHHNELIFVGSKSC